jgi:quercetin dioxygenase-like cupin family protein
MAATPNFDPKDFPGEDPQVVTPAEHRCFCDLAPLYVLGLLSAQERDWVEAQAAGDPDLARELRELQTAATAIPYGWGEETPPGVESSNYFGDLQSRLFEQLDLPPLDLAPSPEPAIPNPFWAIRAQDLDWQPQATPGIDIAWLRQDPLTRQVVGVLRAAAGVHYPQHHHLGREEIYMLCGDLTDGDQTYGPGDYICSAAGTTHAPYTEQGCMFFFHSCMDDQYPEACLGSR